MGLDEDPLAELERIVTPQRPHHDDYEPSYPPEPDYDREQGYDDAYYDDPRERPAVYYRQPVRQRKKSKRGFTMVGAVFALVLVGGVSIAGYRFFASDTMVSSGEPPLIRADGSPVKVVPEQQATADNQQQGKLIYDRVNSAAQDANVVASAEEPVERPPAVPREVSRVILPGGPHANPEPQGNNEQRSAEDMRRVQTIPIAPDRAQNGQNADQIEPILGESARQPTTEGPAAGMSMAGNNAVGIMVGGDDEPQTGSAQPPAGVADQAPSQNPVNVPIPAPRPAQTAMAPREAIPAQAEQPSAPPQNANAPAAAGGFVVQLAATRSDAEARQTYRNLQQRYPQVLSQYQPLVQYANLGEKGTFYRLRVGPFATQSDANIVCNAYKEAGGTCIVQRNG
jgi:hypothetical protein